MKKTIKLAVVAAMALGTTSAFATNGDHLIGLGAKARGMGGVGIGLSHGAESGLANGALITSVKNNEISFGGTVFMPDVETDMGTGGGALTSDADMSMIPEVSIVSKVTDNFYMGIGMWGTAGMGVDHRTGLDSYDAAAVGAQAQANGMAAAGGVYAAAGVNPGDDATVDANAMAAAMQAGQGTVFGALAQGNFNMVTNLQLMQFGVPIAYKTNGLSMAVTPILQYGALDINYNIADANANLVSGNTQGVAQDFGFGFNLGLAYEMEGFTVGATYKSAIDMEYKGQISRAMADFTQTDPSNYSDNLEQPSEIGIGISYTIEGNTIALDYKNIAWSSAAGYEDFGWEDQSVYAIGYEYATKNWAARLGYNYAESAVKENANTLLNTLNLLGFPATVESHVTFGGTYAFSENVSADLAYVYALEAEESYTNMLMQKTTTTHSQSGVSFQLNYNF